MAGGFTGMGCVGDVASPGTVLCATGVSLIPNTGLPVLRFSTYKYPTLPV